MTRRGLFRMIGMAVAAPVLGPLAALTSETEVDEFAGIDAVLTDNSIAPFSYEYVYWYRNISTGEDSVPKPLFTSPIIYGWKG